MSKSHVQHAIKDAGLINSERQIVALFIGDRVFGVDIACILTVLTPHLVTTIPNAPEHIRGIVNVRGRNVPVIDLRKLLGQEGIAGDSDDSRTVIVDAGSLTAGLVVDRLTEVHHVHTGSITPTTVSSALNSLRIISGTAPLPSRGNEAACTISLLDVPRILSIALPESLCHYPEAA